MGRRWCGFYRTGWAWWSWVTEVCFFLKKNFEFSRKVFLQKSFQKKNLTVLKFWKNIERIEKLFKNSKKLSLRQWEKELSQAIEQQERQIRYMTENSDGLGYVTCKDIRSIFNNKMVLCIKVMLWCLFWVNVREFPFSKFFSSLFFCKSLVVVFSLFKNSYKKNKKHYNF